MLKLKVGKLLEFSEEAPRAAVICLTPDLVTWGPQSQLCTDWDQRSNIQLWIFWRGSQGFLHQYLVSFLLTETIKSNVMLARKLLFLCWNLFAFHQVRWWQKSLGCIFLASKLEENHLDLDIPFRCQENHFLQFSITLIGKGWISKQFKCKKIFIPLHYLRRFKLQKYFWLILTWWQNLQITLHQFVTFHIIPFVAEIRGALNSAQCSSSPLYL